ncbi:phenylacetate--CoA ligase family protein [Alteribacillus iranensis]|uniref:Phenylacetate-CoA ligase n=1 Tax=Alteribacillus iranensis TaxID=930128 RepID=A0A1I2BPF4_9BACI|nr:phenylacetate--CoA ligase family protein [Alteribacillus iranensis]SFE57929.1 phenylacetate-CoA ligase [Alteribacillus iranensis]
MEKTTKTEIPYYYKSIDWDRLVSEYEPPIEFMEGTWKWSRDQIETTQLKRLKETLERGSKIPFFQKLWAKHDFDPSDVKSLEDMHKIPQYTIDDIRESIERKPPFGDYQSLLFEDAAHTPLRFYTSGGTTGAPRPTIYSQWDREVGAILSARTFYLQGIRPGDAVINAWAYSTHNAAWIMDHALWHWNGAIPITTGTGNVTPTQKQVEFAKNYGAAAITATSDYLLHIAETAKKMGYDPKTDFNFKTMLSFGDTKAVEEAFGIPAYDSYAFHEVQYVAAECPAKQGLHIFEDAFIVEVCDFETGEPLPPGHRGNIVVTCLYKTGTQQIRYNIQDISGMYEEYECECGSVHKRLEYFQGRSDTMVKLRGVNVWPEACGKIIQEHDYLNGEYFCYVERVKPEGKPARDEMTIMVETKAQETDSYKVQQEVVELLKQKVGVQINVEVVAPDSLREKTGHGERAKLKRFEDRR